MTTKSGIPDSQNSQLTDMWINRNGQWRAAARFGRVFDWKVFSARAGFAAGLAFEIEEKIRSKEKTDSGVMDSGASSVSEMPTPNCD